MRRLGWRLMPVLVLMFLVAFIDRQNIGFAKLQMLSDLHISEAVFGFAASLFFIGYVVFEIPSVLALQRYGARLWLGLLVFGCGVITLTLAFTVSADMLSVLRLLLGAVEAGIYPGVVYYLSTWFPDPYRIRMLGFFTLGSSLGNMVGGPINGALLDFSGWLGACGLAMGFHWRRSARPLLLAFVVFALLPSSPLTAPLSERKRTPAACGNAGACAATATDARKSMVGVMGSGRNRIRAGLYFSRDVLLRHNLLAADHHSRLWR